MGKMSWGQVRMREKDTEAPSQLTEVCISSVHMHLFRGLQLRFLGVWAGVAGRMSMVSRAPGGPGLT